MLVGEIMGKVGKIKKDMYEKPVMWADVLNFPHIIHGEMMGKVGKI